MLVGMTAAALLAVWFLLAPLDSLVDKGPFDWHIQQLEFRQGGLEVLLLWALLFGALSLPDRRHGLLLGLGAAWLYGRRHGVDLSVALVVLYVEAIFALGRTALERIVGPQSLRPTSLLVAGMFGLVVWSLVIWTCSALGLGSVGAIRLIAIAVLGGVLLFYRGPRLVTLVWRFMPTRRLIDRWIVAGLATFFMALFAKSSVWVDFDSAWYGLQSEKVLVGDGSLFASQEMVWLVHYYPKVYEALALPFAGLGSVSLIFGLGIVSWSLIAFTLVAILREYGVSPTLRLIGTALVCSMPALANIAMTAKGDAFAAWLLMMGVLGLVKYRRGNGSQWFWIGLAAIGLGTQSRLSSVPYAALLLMLYGYALVARWRTDGGLAGLKGKGFWIFAIAAILIAASLGRTFHNSGVLLVAPNVAVELQLALGLRADAPAGLLLAMKDDIQRLPLVDGMWGILFDPARFLHLIITWIGNVWIFLPLAFLLLGGATSRRRTADIASWPLLFVGAGFFATMFGLRMLAGGDGNYFIVPITCLTLWGVVLVNKLHDQPRRFLEVALLPFFVCGLGISFITGAWGYGTRPFDAVMTRLPFEYAARGKREIAEAHLQGVAKFFSGMSPGTHVVGLEVFGVSDRLPSGWFLPVQYEVLESFDWQNPSLIASPDAFGRYLLTAGVEYVIVPKRPMRNEVELRVGRDIAANKERGTLELAYQDDHYVVWQVVGGSRPGDGRAPAMRSPLAGKGLAVVSVDEELVCYGSRNQVAKVTWKGAPGPVAIEVMAPGGDVAQLWVAGGNSGTAETGPWVMKGVEFIFRDGVQGKEIGRVSVMPPCP
ncbi:hypothetical protein [Lysobacter panacisoli]|uniref:Glycosyltransferase RgtA/B/C/D-like domain-containing protein n=2 Tax=Lysobacter panacisoli TaxID=1255263 RepID=A0ABP9L409_9GAMM